MYFLTFQKQTACHNNNAHHIATNFEVIKIVLKSTTYFAYFCSNSGGPTSCEAYEDSFITSKRMKLLRFNSSLKL